MNKVHGAVHGYLDNNQREIRESFIGETSFNFFNKPPELEKLLSPPNMVANQKCNRNPY